MNPDRIYLIKLREHVNSNEAIYKIGKTKQPSLKRYDSYPKGSILLYHVICNDCNNCEKEIIKLFRNKYKAETNIGSEYFSGDYIDMINDIHSIVYKNLRAVKDEAIKHDNTKVVDKIDDTVVQVKTDSIKDVDKIDDTVVKIDSIKDVDKIGGKIDDNKVIDNIDDKINIIKEVIDEVINFNKNKIKKIDDNKIKEVINVNKNNIKKIDDNKIIDNIDDKINEVINEVINLNKNGIKYRCHICNKNYTSRQALWKHKKDKHPIPICTEKNKFICKFCNKELYNNYSRWRHEKTCEIKNKELMKLKKENETLKLGIKYILKPKKVLK